MYHFAIIFFFGGMMVNLELLDHAVDGKKLSLPVTEL